ncbi:MAG: hypothetical protein HYV97_03990 [Bdellovibrio sp.]|nr:hypothetical protein [Bdellovibrio sp.]
MKTLLLLSCLLYSALTSAANLDFRCDVLSVKDSNVFEEGLGATGLSDVDEDAQKVEILLSANSKELQVGQHSFSSKEAMVKFDYQDKPTYHKVTATEESQTVQVTVYKTSKLGVLLQKDQNESKYKMVAELDCNDYSIVKKYMLSNKATPVKIKRAAISQATLKRMARIDVPFEMGDGYYDLQSENYYQVSHNGKIVGYILESVMAYTEDDEDVTAQTYFLANGVRFSGPND